MKKIDDIFGWNFQKSLKISLWCCIIVCLSSPSLGETISDSTQFSKDTLAVWNYIDLARKYRYAQPDSAEIFASEARTRAEAMGFPMGQIHACSNLGILARNQSDFSLALDYFYEGFGLSEEIRSIERQAVLARNLGDTYLRAKGREFDSAFYYLNKSLVLYQQLADEKGLMKIHLSLGNLFASVPDLDKAKSHFLMGLPYAEKFGYAPLFQENVGNIYVQKGALDSAAIFYQRLVDAMGDNISINLRHNLAVLAQKRKEYKKAIKLYQDNLSRRSEFPSTDLLVSSLNNLAFAYKMNGQYAEALSSYLEALDIAKKEGLQNRERLLNQQIALIYEQLGNAEKALIFYKEFLRLDSIEYDVQVAQSMNELQVKYETEKKDKELAISEKERQKGIYERNIFLIATLFLVIIVVAGGYVYLQKRRDNIQLSKQKQVIQRREREKALLLRELHHRVKNNLQLISSLLNLQAYQLDDEEAALAVKEGQTRVEAMAIIHRDLYLKNDQTQIAVHQYLPQIMDNVLSSFGVLGRRVQTEIQVDELEIEADLAIPLGLIVNELLTNSLKYAFSDHPNPTLRLRANVLDENTLYLEVADNGPGEKGLSSEQVPSFGSDMVQALAQQIDASLRIENAEGWRTELQIPLVEKEAILTD
ncbi:MAG: histidine kinase dimerization/phosphoacceptor domain -containing protein [Bacteroidota bacterium]